MATKRITDVDIIDSLNGNESFFVNQNSTIKQINKSNVVFGINNGGTGATDANTARMNLGITPKNIGAVTMANTSVELKTDGWEDNKQTVTVNEVTANNMVVVGADFTADNYKFYTECGICCIKQSEGELTFLCEDVPNANITVNVAVFS